MLAVDLRERSAVMALAVYGKDPDQQPGFVHHFQHACVRGDPEQESMEPQIAGDEAMHLLGVQLVPAGFAQFISQCEDLIRKSFEPLQVLRGIRPGSYLADCIHLKGFSQFVQVNNVLPPELNHYRAPIRRLLQQSFRNQLAQRFTDGCTAASELVRQRDLRHRTARRQFAASDLLLDEQVGSLTNGPLCAALTSWSGALH